MTNRAIIDDFIREDEADAAFLDEAPKAVAECWQCGAEIMPWEEAFCMVSVDGKEIVTLCRCCTPNQAHAFADVLDAVGVSHYEGEFAEGVVADAMREAARLRMQKKAAFRRTITTAARMLKEVKA